MEPSDEPTLLKQARPAERVGDALLLDRVRAQLFGRAAPVTVGRYHLLERLGSGGMGVVYAAYDPKLSRRVAIKVLNNERTRNDDTHARARMLREAKAMAALSHPNVLPIFDVGVDRSGVFLAMELVDGVSLDVWLKQARRSIGEILEVFTAAAHGLDAAHQAGLVHRDFKPANVMIDRRSHVFVMDFGLARATATVTLDPPEASASQADDTLTQTGVANGSPAYMSPQQHRGEPPDPRSDQWSFGVSLYEALYGRLPFGGATLQELRASVFGGIDQLPKRVPAVPARLEVVLRRALRQDPADRFESVAALIAALGPAGHRRAALWLATFGLVGALGWIGGSAPSGAAHACGPNASAEVWNESRRFLLRSDFHRVAKPFVTRAWRRLEEQVDAYLAGWVDAESRTCLLTDPMRARAQACLDLRLQSLDDSLTVLEQSDPEVVAQAVDVLGALPSIAECEPSVLTRGRDDSMDSPEAAPIVTMLNKSHTLTRTTRYGDAVAVLHEALPPARRLDGRTLEIRVLVALGQAQAEDGDFDASLRTLEEAVFTAEAASLDAEALDAAIEAARIAINGGQLELADRWIALAHSRLELTGEDGVRRVRLYLAESDLAEARGNWKDAEALAARAVARVEGADPGDQGIAWATMGRAHYRAKRWKDAQAAYERAIDLLLPQIGEEHPSILMLQTNIALTAIGDQDFVRARDLIAATIPTLREALGDSNLPLAAAYGNLALAHDGLGEFDRSLALQRQALEIRREILGDHPNVAMTAYNIGLQLVKQGQNEAAAASFREAIDMLSATVGPDNHLLLGPHVRAAEANLNLGRLEAAERNLERARELEDTLGLGIDKRLRTNFFGARLLGAQGKHDEAHRLAAQTRAQLLAGPDPGGAFATELIEQIDAWEREPRPVARPLEEEAEPPLGF